MSSCSLFATSPTSTSFGFRQEVERDKIGTRFLERREVFLDGGLRIPLQPLVDLARRVPDHLVHVRRELAGKGVPPDRAAPSPPASRKNSLRNSGSVDLSYASLMFESDTDLLPYSSRMA